MFSPKGDKILFRRSDQCAMQLYVEQSVTRQKHGCLASTQVIWLYPHAYGDGQNLRVFVVSCTHNPFLRLKVIFQLWRQRTLLLLPFGEPVSKVTDKSFCQTFRCWVVWCGPLMFDSHEGFKFSGYKFKFAILLQSA